MRRARQVMQFGGKGAVEGGRWKGEVEGGGWKGGGGRGEGEGSTDAGRRKQNRI